FLSIRTASERTVFPCPLWGTGAGLGASILETGGHADFGRIDHLAGHLWIARHLAIGGPRRCRGIRRRISFSAHRIAARNGPGSRGATAPPGGPAAGGAGAVQG